MEVGTVIFFNNETGFGVIRDDGGKKIFLHYSEIQSHAKKLYEGQKVRFETRKGLSDSMALNIRLR